MMSKNSFLVNMKENLKRRNWIAVVFSVIFLLAFPVGISLWISSFSNRRMVLGEETWLSNMTNGLTNYISINMPVTILITALAIICAIQGFSFLFRRQKLDLYMSVPVSKKRRFSVIYLNGILLFAVPYLCSLLIGVLIGAVNGILTGVAIKCMLYSCLAYIIYYTAIYNITIIAVMLTGNLIISLCVTVMLLFYEIAVKGLIVGLCAIFYKTYSSYGVNLKTCLSPVIEMVECTTKCNAKVLTIPHLIENSGISMLKIFIFALITGVIGYFLFTIRPAESCNKAIAFFKTKPFIKILLMIPSTLLVGILFYSVANGNTAMTVFGLVLGIILSHSVIEIIFEFDLKAALKNLKSGVLGAVFVFAFFALFRFDLTGFDKWVPEPDKVESIAFAVSGATNQQCYYDWEKESWIDGTDYCFNHMKLSDTEGFCSLMKQVVNDELMNRDTTFEESEIPYFFWAEIEYRMKNGKEKYRRIRIPYEKYESQLIELTDNDEFRKGTYQLLNEKFIQDNEIASITFSNGIQRDEINREDIEKVFENYKNDLMNFSFSEMARECPVGVIYIDLKNKKAEMNVRDTWGLEMPVYASFENTMAYAKEKDYLSDWKKEVSTEFIKEITISRWDYDSDVDREKTFADKEMIEALLPALVPYEINNYLMFREDDDGYDAYVDFEKFSNRENQEYSGYFEVNASLLPDFAILE